MRSYHLLFIILLGATGYYGYSLYNQQKRSIGERDEKIASLEKKLAETEKQETAVKRIAPPSSQKVICPACVGEGFLMYRPNAGDIQTKYPCPVCNGSGGRMIKLPPGTKNCPDCSGMGKRLYCSSLRQYSGADDQYRMSGRPCKRCSMCGYVQADVHSSP